MKISLSDIEKEGFSVFHGKWGDSKVPKSIIGLDGKRKNFAFCILHFGFSIGYFAYPNPTLKNIIPSSRFYGYDKLLRLPKPPVVDGDFKTTGKLEQSVSKPQYIKKIKRVKELLADGEIYQMCYCIRFRKKFSGSPYALFLKLTEVNPVDFAAYLNCGDFQIISSSPERLFKVKNGKITTTPIKGTASKAKTRNSLFRLCSGHKVAPLVRAGETLNKRFEFRTSSLEFLSSKDIGDKNLLKLLQSDKERAELDMITDLERNDVGKICEYGTLKLKKEREVLELKNLWHTYSEVEGKLRSNVSQKEIIDAMFPGGSITGCPKKRAMQYIEELEGLPRNIFTGSIGYISNGARGQCKCKGSQSATCTCHLHLGMDFNIAIRTILIKDGYLEFWAGGGIVADSEPEKEYEECLLKAEKFLGII